MVVPAKVGFRGYIIRTPFEVSVRGYLITASPSSTSTVISPITITKESGGSYTGDREKKRIEEIIREDDEILDLIKIMVQCLN